MANYIIQEPKFLKAHILRGGKKKPGKKYTKIFTLTAFQQ